MSKSASRPVEQPAFPYESVDSSSASTALAWKQEVNQRLAAHRNRRGGPADGSNGQSPSGSVADSSRPPSGRAAEAAARVAARYAKAPSYSQLLASEARAVVRAAGVAAEAARDAQAAAEAVLAGLESGPLPPQLWQTVPQAASQPTHQESAVSSARWQDEPPVTEALANQAWAGAQPRWQEALPATAPPPEAGRQPGERDAEHDIWAEMRVHSLQPEKQYRYHAEEYDLFPADAFASATVEPIQHLPANLIEFPKELVAARKARPRLAEGPFAPQESSQLSIFEVDPELLAPPIAMSSAASQAIAPPEWASIELDHPPERVYDHHAVETAYAQPVDSAVHFAEQSYSLAEAAAPDYAGVLVADAPVAESRVLKSFAAASAEFATAPAAREFVRESAQVRSVAPPVELLVAPVSDRLLASVVDGALVTLACLAASTVVIASTEHPPTGRIALIAFGFAWMIFTAMYQFLFLSYAEEGTPGMRYARIALCTFTDDNPTREQMRMRIPAMMISALPAGLGLLWATFDSDHLSWHDRLTRTYQRKY